MDTHAVASRSAGGEVGQVLGSPSSQEVTRAEPVMEMNDVAEPQPWLTYPVGLRDTDLYLPPIDTARTLSPLPRFLTALLGHTRAVVLWTSAHHPGCTTTELARRAGISLAGAGQHATVLRTAGLTTTTRHHTTALHTTTPIGVSMLNSAG
ncbi:hypothetical protein ACFRCI_50210 [Streptomyces sp. NPDC056638]|uniref:hypothetical protein n=1 Tax=Streptomyces sp. NPDC056638 TaxID=3345887 RepID=UPI00367E02BE